MREIVYEKSTSGPTTGTNEDIKKGLEKKLITTFKDLGLADITKISEATLIYISNEDTYVITKG